MWDESMDESDEDSGDDYIDDSEKPRKKQLRFNFLTSTPKNVVKSTAHQVKHFDTSRYQAVWTCPGCHRMLAYKQNGKYYEVQYGYDSKSGNYHEQRALEIDHFPPWAGRLKSLEKSGANRDEMRDDYQDESRLRALCRVCNGSHQFEGEVIDDYDSSEDDFNPQRTPKHETQYNSGQFSGYREPTWLSKYPQ